MRNRWLAYGTVGVVVAVVSLFATRTPGQAREHQTDDQVTRISETHPDLSGIWQAVGTAHWNLEAHEARQGPIVSLGAAFSIPAGESFVEGGTIPYEDWAAAQRKDNQENWLSRDPEIKCYLPGVPRATYMPYPLQIIQGSEDTVIAYSFANAMRIIRFKKEQNEALNSLSDLWMGWSIGRWEGDTLAVDVRGFNDQTWFDRSGNFHSDQLRLEERYTLTTPDILTYEATIEDPKVFTRPWKLKVPLYRMRQATLLEYQCIPFAEELLYGHLYKE